MLLNMSRKLLRCNPAPRPPVSGYQLGYSDVLVGGAPSGSKHRHDKDKDTNF